MAKANHLDLDLSRGGDRAAYRVRVFKEFSFVDEALLIAEAVRETGRDQSEFKTRIACTNAIADHRINALRPQIIDQANLEQAIISIIGQPAFDATNSSGLINAHLHAIKRAFMAQPNDPERPQETVLREAMRALDKKGRYPFYDDAAPDEPEPAPRR